MTSSPQAERPSKREVLEIPSQTLLGATPENGMSRKESQHSERTCHLGRMLRHGLPLHKPSLLTTSLLDGRRAAPAGQRHLAAYEQARHRTGAAQRAPRHAAAVPTRHAAGECGASGQAAGAHDALRPACRGRACSRRPAQGACCCRSNESCSRRTACKRTIARHVLDSSQERL